VKRSITLAIATLATAALAGCGTGMYSQTADQVAPVPGYSQTYNIADQSGGTVGVRNAHLPYPGLEGFKAGSDVQIKLWLFNNTQKPVTVVVTSDEGTLKEEVIIPSAQLAAPEMSLVALKTDIKPGQSLPIKIEFVGHVVMEAILPVAPPQEALPRSPLPGPEGEGH
jgi:hypothetical protein